VDAYRDQDPGVEGLTRHSQDDISRAIGSLLSAPPADNAWAPIDLCAAAMLHTDVFLALLKDKKDADAQFHLNGASRLIDAVRQRSPAHATFVRRWRIVVAGLLNAYGASAWAEGLESAAAGEATTHVESSRAFERGLVSEIQAAMAGDVSGPSRPYAGRFPRAAEAPLLAAAREYEAALAAHPGFSEAALHLGRVRMMLGHDDAATRWLTHAAAEEKRGRVLYLATLFLGAIAERQGQHADAERHYRVALADYRWGQAAAFALAQLLSRLGREDEARAVLIEHFQRTRRQVVEPLWTYLAESGEQLGRSLSELRAETWR
jgi:tetratricopeptide (TPR) repeat protein